MPTKINEDTQVIVAPPAKRNIRETQMIQAGRCMGCGVLVAVESLNKNWLCPMCVIHDPNSYKNSKWFGVQDGKPPFSFEFEVQYPHHSREGINVQELIDMGFLQTADCTVDDEWKSPIMREFAVLEEMLPILDQFKQYVGPHAGTHIHVQADHQSKINTAGPVLFEALRVHLKDRTEETRKFWGRYFGAYCGAQYGGWVYAGDRAQPTLEWRLAKYHDAEQFKRLLLFVRDQTQWLDYEMGRFNRRSDNALVRLSTKMVEEYKKVVN